LASQVRTYSEQDMLAFIHHEHLRFSVSARHECSSSHVNFLCGIFSLTVSLILPIDAKTAKLLLSFSGNSMHSLFYLCRQVTALLKKVF
jgi:hypothetical protein